MIHKNFLTLFLILAFSVSFLASSVNASFPSENEGYTGALMDGDNVLPSIPFGLYQVSGNYFAQIGEEWFSLGSYGGYYSYGSYNFNFKNGAYLYYKYDLPEGVAPEIKQVMVDASHDGGFPSYFIRLAFDEEQKLDTANTKVAMPLAEKSTFTRYGILGHYVKGSNTEVFEFEYDAEGNPINMGEMGEPFYGETVYHTNVKCFVLGYQQFSETGDCAFFSTSSVKKLDSIPSETMVKIEGFIELIKKGKDIGPKSSESKEDILPGKVEEGNKKKQAIVDPEPVIIDDFHVTENKDTLVIEEIAPLKGEVIQSVSKKSEMQGSPYIVTSSQQTRLFGFIPISIEIKREISKDGVVAKEEKPWWGFFTFS